MLTLIFHSDDFPGPMQPIEWDTDIIVIGRNAACDVTLPDRSVSQRHASISQVGDEYVLTDEGSANGTFLGEARLEPLVPQSLKNADMFRVGEVWLEVRTEPLTLQEPPPANRESTSPLRDTLPLLALLVTSGKGGSSRIVPFTPGAGPYVIGRDIESCALSLSDLGVSREHAQVSWRDGTAFVRDLGSRNGTIMHGASLPAHRDVPWKLSVEIQLASTRIELVTAGAERMGSEPGVAAATV